MTPIADDSQEAADTILLELIICFLTPMFFAASGSNIARSRQAAIHAVQAFCANDPAELLFVAQIIGFGLAAMSSLSRSLMPEVGDVLMLQLQKNANTCFRSAELARKAHEKAAAQPKQAAAPKRPTEAEQRQREQEMREQVAAARQMVDDMKRQSRDEALARAQQAQRAAQPAPIAPPQPEAKIPGALKLTPTPASGTHIEHPAQTAMRPVALTPNSNTLPNPAAAGTTAQHDSFRARAMSTAAMHYNALYPGLADHVLGGTGKPSK